MSTPTDDFRERDLELAGYGFRSRDPSVLELYRLFGQGQSGEAKPTPGIDAHSRHAPELAEHLGENVVMFPGNSVRRT